MTFERAQKVADAFLYDRQPRSPGRAPNHRLHWTLGVMTPTGFRDGGEISEVQTDLLVRPSRFARVEARLRFLQLHVHASDGWGEPAERTLPIPPVRLENLPRTYDLSVPDDALRARVRVSAREVEGMVRLRLRVANTTPGSYNLRFEALLRSFVGFHVLVSLAGGTFVSLLDPPPEAASALSLCRNLNTWPVLIGPEMALSSPMILYRPDLARDDEEDLFASTQVDRVLDLGLPREQRPVPFVRRAPRRPV